MRQVFEVLRKDLLIEWRGKGRVLAVCAYAVTLMLLFSFAVGPNTKVLQLHASGYLWVAVLSASTLLLAQSFQIETEGGALEGMLLLPVDPRAMFYGKALSNWVILVLVALVALPVSLVLFDLGVTEGLPKMLLVVVLGAGGVAAPGTLYAAMTARMQAQQLMLPLLLFPLIVPALLAAAKAGSLVLLGDPMGQVGSWTLLLGCFNLIYWSLCGVLFGKVVEE